MDIHAGLIETSQVGHVLTLTLADTRTGNSLTTAMSEAVADAFTRVNALSDVHCVVLRSSARHFCTGGSVEDMRDGTDLMAGSVSDIHERLRKGLQRITRAIHAVEVPIIAAVNGAAVGAGFDLSMMCDIRWASERARFAESFLRLGLVSGIGGAWFLTRAVGLSKAMELSLTSDFHDATSALALGLVSHVLPADELDAGVDALARRIAASPPTALRLSKRLVRQATACDLETALDGAASVQAALLVGAEHKAAVDRFFAQREVARAKRP